MAEVRLCRDCAAKLTGDAPEGLCTACLHRRPALDAGTGAEQQAGTALYLGRASPAPADLAEYFPGLEILGVLGQGGMGTVYKARQLKLDRLIALKILSAGPAAGGNFADRFLREARALARLSHPHIVAVHDFGEAGPLYYFVMEFVEGGSLRQCVRPGRLAQADAVALLLQICDALQYAHEEGIVHRDVKPENLLLDRRGRIKVADFGLAKLLDSTPAAFTLTGSQQAMGTPHYMAPEQWEKAHAVDHRADIWSLGVVFYEMLTGELPLGRFGLPSQLAAVDPRLDEVVLRALEKDPRKRYPQIAGLKADVQAVATGQGWPFPAAVAPAATLPIGTAPAVASSATQITLPGTAATDVGAQALTAARRQVSGPAAGLTWAGALSVLQPLLLPVLLANPSFSDAARLVLVDTMVFGVAFGVVTLLAARRMRRLEAPEFAFIGSILALVPLGPAWGLGLPMGIWALMILRKPEVRAAFAAPKPEPPPRPRRLPGATVWAGLCCVLAVGVSLVPWSSFLVRNGASEWFHQVHGVQTWQGTAVALLFLALAVSLFVARRGIALPPLAGVAVVAFLVIAPLTGLALVLLLVIFLAQGGLPGRGPEGMPTGVTAGLAFGVVLIATVFLRKPAVWRGVAMLLTGLAAAVLVAWFLAEVQGDRIESYLLSPLSSASRVDGEWKAGRAGLTAGPFLVLGCAAILIVLGCYQLLRPRPPEDGLSEWRTEQEGVAR